MHGNSNIKVVKKLAAFMDPNSLLPWPSVRKSSHSQLYAVCILIIFPQVMFIQPSSFRRPVRSGFFHRLRIRSHLVQIITVIFYGKVTYGRDDKCKESFGCETWKKGPHKGPNFGETILLKRILKNYNMKAWTRLGWLNVGTVNALLCIQQRTFVVP